MGSLQQQDQFDAAQLDLPRPRSRLGQPSTADGGEPPAASLWKDLARARAPKPQEPPEERRQERPSGEHRVVELPQPDQERHDEPGHPQGGDGPLIAKLRRHSLALALGLFLWILAAAAGALYWDYAQHFQSTDDAFIAARQFAIAPKVSGYITEVPVTDNQHVSAGDVIARIDERDYRIALDQAQAQVDNADANIQNLDAQINVQQAQITANRAQLDQAQAALVFAKQQAARYADLAQKGSGTVQNAEQYSSQLRQQEAAVESAHANLQLAQQQLESVKAQRKAADARLEQAKAQRDQAQLNLSYTTVRAAQGGRVVNLSAAAGQFAQPGTNLSMFVPDDIWVTANFKETQLEDMRPNQQVALEIDAYPHREIRGHVASIQPGSGTAFSLLPPQNATGNYVKIVQRVPVKIVIDEAPADVTLGPGMSVVPTVRVDPTPSLYERIKGWV